MYPDKQFDQQYEPSETGASTRCRSDPSLRARVQLSQQLKPKKATMTGDPFWFLVEAAGVEPASASTLPLALHA